MIYLLCLVFPLLFLPPLPLTIYLSDATLVKQVTMLLEVDIDNSITFTIPTSTSNYW